MENLTDAFYSLRESLNELLSNQHSDYSLFIQRCKACDSILKEEKPLYPFELSIQTSIEIFQFKDLSSGSFWKDVPNLYEYFGYCTAVRTAYEDEYRQFVVSKGYDRLLNFEK